MAFKVRDAMTTSLVTADFDMTVNEVCDLLVKHHVSGVPVVDRQKRLVGVVSEYDLLDLAFDCRFGTRWIREFLNGKLVTIEDHQSLTDAADCFVRYNVRRLPVLKAGRLVGVLTRRDLLRYIRDLRHATRHMICRNEMLRFSSKRQIAKRCGVSLNTLRRKIESGEFQASKQDGCYWVSAEAFEDLKKVGNEVTDSAPIA